MSGHLIESIKTKPTRPPGPFPAGYAVTPSNSECVAGHVAELHALSRRGLWGLLLFLVLSAAALWLREVALPVAAQEELRVLFGPLPTTDMLNLILAVSWFSALAMIIGRRDADGKPGYNWYNVGLPTAFYPLYVFCDTTGTYFPAVFVAGLILLLLEYAFVLSYTVKAIRAETARQERLPR